MIGKRLRSPEKDAVVAQVFRDGFFAEYAYSRRICFSLLLSSKRMKIFSGKCPGVGATAQLSGALLFVFLRDLIQRDVLFCPLIVKRVHVW